MNIISVENTNLEWKCSFMEINWFYATCPYLVQKKWINAQEMWLSFQDLGLKAYFTYINYVKNIK